MTTDKSFPDVITQYSNYMFLFIVYAACGVFKRQVCMGMGSARLEDHHACAIASAWLQFRITHCEGRVRQRVISKGISPGSPELDSDWLPYQHAISTGTLLARSYPYASDQLFRSRVENMMLPEVTLHARNEWESPRR